MNPISVANKSVKEQVIEIITGISIESWEANNAILKNRMEQILPTHPNVRPFWPASTTHVHSLSHNTPKSRRRVRATLGLPVGAPVGPVEVASAVSKAVTGETRHNPQTEKKRR